MNTKTSPIYHSLFLQFISTLLHVGYVLLLQGSIFTQHCTNILFSLLRILRKTVHLISEVVNIDHQRKFHKLWKTFGNVFGTLEVWMTALMDQGISEKLLLESVKLLNNTKKLIQFMKKSKTMGSSEISGCILKLAKFANFLQRFDKQLEVSGESDGDEVLLMDTNEDISRDLLQLSDIENQNKRNERHLSLLERRMSGINGKESTNLDEEIVVDDEQLVSNELDLVIERYMTGDFLNAHNLEEEEDYLEEQNDNSGDEEDLEMPNKRIKLG
jgi:hypothetical protein